MTNNAEIRQPSEKATDQPASSRFSLDTWAVFLAFALALLIRAGVIKHVPW
jgi:hypothetical protein